MKRKKIETSLYVFGYLLELCIEIWQTSKILLNFISGSANFFQKIKRNSGLKKNLIFFYNNGKFCTKEKRLLHTSSILHGEGVGVDSLWLSNNSVLINDVHLIGLCIMDHPHNL
jgi:hypothetical protein